MNEAQRQVMSEFQLSSCTPIIVGSMALRMKGMLNRKPGDLDFAVKSSEFEKACNVLEKLGGKIWLDNPNSKGFDLRRQYKLNGEKFDLFIVGDNVPYDDTGKGFGICNVDQIWAARGYYAKSSKKYQQQLVDAGYWTADRIPRTTLGGHVDKAVWWLGGIIRKLKR
jgi:hypothetical protein